MIKRGMFRTVLEHLTIDSLLYLYKYFKYVSVMYYVVE